MYLKISEIDYSSKKSLNCKATWKYTLPLVTSDLTSLILNISAWATLNIDEGDTSFKCYYSSVERSTIEYNDNNPQ